MGVSKVVYGDDTLVDLTDDTVTPTSLTLGATAHAANGEQIVGEYQYVLPPMSPTTRGGARIQPDSGLEVTDTDNLQVRLALESDGTVRGGISQLTAKGHAEQDGTPTPDNPVPIQVVRGRNLCDSARFSSEVSEAVADFDTLTSYTTNGITFTRNQDGSIRAVGTCTATTIFFLALDREIQIGEEVMLSGCPANGSVSRYRLDMYRTENSIETSDFGDGQSLVLTKPINRIRVAVYAGTWDITFKPQLTLGSTPQPYVPYGYVGMEAQGRNILDVSDIAVSNANLSVETLDDAIRFKLTSSAAWQSGYIPLSHLGLTAGASYVITAHVKVTSGLARIAIRNSSWTIVNESINTSGEADLTCSFTYDPNTQTYVSFMVTGNVASTADVTFFRPMLRLASDMDDTYEPYYHTTTPILLPQRGWVAGLSDGTADSLRLDGAGHAEWKLPTSEVVFDGSEGWSLQGSGVRVSVTLQGIKRPSSASAVWHALSSHFAAKSGNATWSETTPGFSASESGDTIHFADGTKAMTVAAWTAWLASHNVTLLYPLATPVTEDCGYVDMPAIPSDATISIPELDALNVKYFIDDAVLEYGRQMYARAVAEIGGAVVDLAARVAALES